MALMIVQLSDLHAATGKEPVFSIRAAICRAVAAELDGRVDACVILFNGDAAYGGKAGEFKIAADLLRGLRDDLSHGHPAIRFHILSVPGNHDCDLTSEDPEARNALRRTVGSGVPSPSVSRILLGAQQEYFRFAKTLDDIESPLSLASPYFGHVDVQTDGGLVRFDLLNSAWTSVIHETDDLKYPLAAFAPPALPEAQYAIAVVHHPPHWFQMPGVRRELRDLLEAHADLILTGHEHENEASRRATSDGGEIAYTEGGVLHDPRRPGLITFNVVLLDLAGDRQLIRRFQYAGGHFTAGGPSQATSLQSNRLRKDREFRLLRDFEEWLDEFEDPLSHPRVDDLRLSHLFAYPDLRKITDQAERAVKRKTKAELVGVVKSEKVADEIMGQSRGFISGGDKAGKTTLLKQLFGYLHRHGKVPVFIRGSEVHRSGDAEALRKQVAAAVTKQYQFLDAEAFEQLDKDKRVLLIDDLQHTSADPEVTNRILAYAHDRFGVSILSASTDFFIEFIGNNSSGEADHLYDYQRYEIADFGQQRFEELATKWTALGRRDEDPKQLKNAALELCDKVRSLVAVAQLPYTPWLLLVILEHDESPDATIAAKNGDIGHLYNAVITVKLAQSGSARFNLTGKFTYLSELAYELYKTGTAVIREGSLRAFHSTYLERFDLTFDYERVRDDLVTARMLRLDGDEVAFRHRFVFAFFVAYWISRNIHKPEAQEVVRHLCARLDHDISANVLVFLAHLTDNPIVLQEMKASAAALLSSASPARMEAEVRPLNELCGVPQMRSLPSTPPDVNRRLAQEHADDREARSHRVDEQDGRLIKVSPPEEDVRQELHKSVRELRAALKTIRILGQVLRNKALATESDDKVALMEETLLLSRRVLGYLYGYLDELKSMVTFLRKRLMETLVDERKGELRRKIAKEEGGRVEADPRLTRTDLRNIWGEAGGLARQFWFDIFASASFGAVKIAAAAVGSRDLDTTLAKIRARSDCIPLQLIDLNVRMNRRGTTVPLEDFEKMHRSAEKTRNRVAQIVLDAMGWERAVFFETAPTQLQALCKAMGVSKVPEGAYDSAKKKLFAGGKARPRKGK